MLFKDLISNNLETVLNSSLVLFAIYAILITIYSNKRFYFIELTILFAIIQWLIAPSFIETLKIDYLNVFQIGNKSAIILYFSLAIYCSISLLIILHFFKRKEKNKIIYSFIEDSNELKTQLKYKKLGLFYLKIGIFSSIFSFVFSAIPVIGVINSFLWNLIPIGSLFLVYSNIRNKVFIILMTLSYILLIGVKSSLFMHSVFWIIIIFLFIMLKHPIHVTIKLLFITFMLPAFAILQIAKGGYRKELWYGNSENNSSISLLISNLKNSNNNTDFTKKGNLAYIPLAIRMNQAHIDGKVIKIFPNKRNFLHGFTIAKSFLSVFVPRIIWPNKYGYSNQKMIELAEHKNGGNSFFTVSIMAECYANFGFEGGLLFFIVLFFILKILYIRMLKLKINGIPFIFFVPTIFFTTIRTEIDFYQLFANIIMSYIIFYFVLKNTKYIISY
jgi:hypothetical protein